MRILGGDHQPDAATNQWCNDLATLFCASLSNTADPYCTAGTFSSSGGVDHRDYGAHLCSTVNKRHYYRDG